MWTPLLLEETQRTRPTLQNASTSNSVPTDPRPPHCTDVRAHSAPAESAPLSMRGGQVSLGGDPHQRRLGGDDGGERGGGGGIRGRRCRE